MRTFHQNFSTQNYQQNYLRLIQIRNWCNSSTKAWEQLAYRSFQIEVINPCRTKLLSFRNKTLPIIFAWSKFNEYLCDKTFIIESGHKPLKSILKTPIHKRSPRIQRFIMFLQKQKFVVNYVPGKDLICSDTLSRAQLIGQTTKISQREVNCQAHSVISSVSMTTERLKPLEVEKLTDKTLQKVESYIAPRGPKLRNQLNTI